MDMGDSCTTTITNGPWMQLCELRHNRTPSCQARDIRNSIRFTNELPALVFVLPSVWSHQEAQAQLLSFRALTAPGLAIDLSHQL